MASRTVPQVGQLSELGSKPVSENIRKLARLVAADSPAGRTHPALRRRRPLNGMGVATGDNPTEFTWGHATVRKVTSVRRKRLQLNPHPQLVIRSWICRPPRPATCHAWSTTS